MRETFSAFTCIFKPLPPLGQSTIETENLFRFVGNITGRVLLPALITAVAEVHDPHFTPRPPWPAILESVCFHVRNGIVVVLAFGIDSTSTVTSLKIGSVSSLFYRWMAGAFSMIQSTTLLSLLSLLSDGCGLYLGNKNTKIHRRHMLVTAILLLLGH